MIKRVEFSCMGSYFHIEAENPSELEQWFAKVEKTYSRFIKESELSRFNQMPISDNWIPVSQEFYFVMAEVTRFYQMTDFLFNPFLGGQLRALGYDRPFSEMQRQVQKTMCPLYQENGILLHKEQPMIKKVKEVEVDLGGYIKSWSVDKAFHMAKGEDVFINGGGDMRFSFIQPQVIGVMNPFDSDTDIAQLNVQKGSIATSNVLHRRWQTKDGEYHHVLNGQTGENPTSNVVQVTVLASTTRQAEVYAKVLCMMDLDQVEIWIAEKQLSIAAIIIMDNKSIWVTGNINEYCEGVTTAWSSQRGNGPEFQA
ncbi:FAD:protein FMN transferase [Paenisporosarcina antarctica]|uniref:FAD:protein FMN transferase n=1 Tax=Paenisporosarcina antarctica TaxID=417367 RepID=A0A4P6ZW24_9BACL|nr:FAD:protein FMN transferase [Paenisporosarcina antarctica]QBP40239.1 hypothetical protein E2636_03335 [Paenisporosarcina antarctica]